MSDDPAPQTLERIAQAQSYAGRPIADRMVEPTSIGALVAAHARARPDAPYLTYLGDGGEVRRLCYGEFHARARALAAYLEERGLGPGDRVTTVSHNHAETVVAYFAIFLLGGVVVPFNAGEDDERLVFTVANSESKAVFVMRGLTDRVDALRARLGGVAHWIEIEGKGTRGYVAMDEAVAAGGARVAAGALVGERASLADEALIVYTSGTTGTPKGVVLTQYNLLVDALGIARWHGLGPDDRLMCVLPIHHVNGIVVTLVTPMFVGASTVLSRKFHVKGFWRSLAEHRVNVVSVVPTLLAFLCEEGEDPRAHDLGAFRYFVCGAGPLTVELAQRFEDRFGFRILHGYGLSETTCYSCFLPTDLPDAEHRAWMRDHGFPSIGLPIDVNEMQIQTPDGREVAEGERGEIVIRGHNVMKYYYRRPEANAETFANGWFRSGDEGFVRRDRRGRPFFFITGRIKELIIRGGVNISPLEIDEVLGRIPGVACGLAVGFENNFYGEEVGAYVKREPGAAVGAEAILAAAARELPFHKQPKVVVFGDDIPVTSTGKYQRNRLKPLFEKWRDVQFRKPK